MIQFNVMDISIDLESPVPIYEQLVLEIQRLVERGLFQSEKQLPPVRELARDLGVNFNTVARAYRILEEQGLVSVQHGRGTFVLEHPLSPESTALKEKQLNQLTRYYLRKAHLLGFEDQEIKSKLEEFQTGREEE
jgi:GntR family transcriptional regulator